MKYYTVTIFKGSSGFPASDDRYETSEEALGQAVAAISGAGYAPHGSDALTRDGEGASVDERDSEDQDYIETVEFISWAYDFHGDDDERLWAIVRDHKPIDDVRVA